MQLSTLACSPLLSSRLSLSFVLQIVHILHLRRSCLQDLHINSPLLLQLNLHPLSSHHHCSSILTPGQYGRTLFVQERRMDFRRESCIRLLAYRSTWLNASLSERTVITTMHFAWRLECRRQFAQDWLMNLSHWVIRSVREGFNQWGPPIRDSSMTPEFDIGFTANLETFLARNCRVSGKVL